MARLVGLWLGGGSGVHVRHGDLKGASVRGQFLLSTFLLGPGVRSLIFHLTRAGNIYAQSHVCLLAHMHLLSLEQGMEGWKENSVWKPGKAAGRQPNLPTSMDQRRHKGVEMERGPRQENILAEERQGKPEKGG